MIASEKSRREVLYPSHYTWIIFLASMDIMTTFIVLYFGGREANALVTPIIHRFGIPGMVIFKLAVMAIVIVLCEITGQRNRRAGRFLATVAIVLNCVPILWGIWLIFELVTR